MYACLRGSAKAPAACKLTAWQGATQEYFWAVWHYRRNVVRMQARDSICKRPDCQSSAWRN